MKLSISLSLILIILLQNLLNFTETQSAEENTTLFFKKILKLFTEVVHELKTKISVLKEELRILNANASETAITVNNVQSQLSSNTQALEDRKTSGSFIDGAIEKLQGNMSENSLNIQKLEIMNSEVDNKILNLTIAVSQNTLAILNPNSNTSIGKNGIGTGKPKTCLEIQTQNRVSKSEVYEIFPTPGQIGGIEVYCDLETEGGGWTVFQSRSDKGPRVDFYRGWLDYEKGFGTAGHEFWIGLQNLAAMTAAGDQELRIDLGDWDNKFSEAKYSVFKVADKSDKYRLRVGNYTGTAGDSLNPHNGKAFTTRDRDNDDEADGNCAQDRRGAWWYFYCAACNLNGDSSQNGTNKGIMWEHWRGYRYNLRTVQMKIRTRDVL